MSKASASISQDLRDRTVRRLASTAAFSVFVQAALFFVLAWLYRAGAQFALDALANASHSPPPPFAEALAAGLVVALELFTALAIGFFASRRLLMAVVRITPHPMKPPTRPVPWASLCAGGVVAAASMLELARQPLVDAASWSFEVLRDAAIVAIFWYAAVRAVGPLPRR